jgi:hypothetical protein
MLYVAAGAVIVIVAAAATGSYLRRAEAGSAPTSEESDGIRRAESDTRLESTTLPAPDRTAERQTADLPLEANEFASATAPAALRRTGGAPRERGSDRLPAGEQGSGAAPGSAASAEASGTPQGAAPAGDAPGSAATLDRIEREIDQLSVRAASVNESLDRLREEQARQGLGLRGDITTRQRAMDLNLSRAIDAHDRGDAARADRYRALAADDIDALEKFLGR